MNLNNLRKVQLHGAKFNADGGHVAITTAMARPFGFASPPSVEENDQFTPVTASLTDGPSREFVESDAASLPAVRSMLALTSLDHQIHNANRDARLSPSGRAEALQEPRLNTIKTIAKAGADLSAHGAKLAQSETDFYKPAKLPLNDVQAASEDRELRDMWRTAPVAKRTVMLGEMGRGEHVRMLEALVRSPVPLEAHEGPMITDMWHAAVNARSPKQSSELKTARKTYEWSDSVVKAAARYARRSTELSSTEIMQAAKDTDAAHLFDDNSIRAVNAA